jgi:hypothetical protein
MELGCGSCGMAVKRFRSSYIFFLKENFGKVAAATKNPKTGRRRSARFIFRELGRCWRRLPAAEMCRFRAMADKDKLRWQREVREKSKAKKNTCVRCVALGQGAAAAAPAQER